MGKVEEKKPKKVGLKPFYYVKSKKRKFKTSPPSKERIEFQKQIMEEVVKGKQL